MPESPPLSWRTRGALDAVIGCVSKGREQGIEKKWLCARWVYKSTTYMSCPRGEVSGLMRSMVSQAGAEKILISGCIMR